MAKKKKRTYTKKGYSRNLKKANALKRLGKSKTKYGGNRIYGNIKYTRVKWHGWRFHVTTAKKRLQQYPKEAKKKRISYGTEVFTVGTKKRKKVRAFEYLPHVPASRRLGHPVALGDDIIVEIHFRPTNTFVNMYEAWLKQRGKSVKGVLIDQLKREVRWISAYYFKIAIDEEIKPRIHELVPKASGRLQRGMIATLNRCRRYITTLPHILKINTLDSLSHPIYYANPVNNMPTEWLAHDGETRVYYFSTGPKLLHLNDPTAETDWYSKVIDHAQIWFKTTLKPLWKACVSLFGINLFSMAMYKHLKENMKFK